MRSIKELMARLPADGRSRNLLRKFNMAPLVDRKAKSVKDLANQLGISVAQVELPKGMAGRLVQDAFSDSGYAIEVSRKQSVQARRFAVLHELGHFFLHTRRNDYLSDPLFLDRSGETFYVNEVEEREANQFAEVLLFGDGALRGAVGIYGRDLFKLAHHFGVSEKTIEIALRRF